jgi:hypothetical protein
LKCRVNKALLKAKLEPYLGFLSARVVRKVQYYLKALTIPPIDLMFHTTYLTEHGAHAKWECGLATGRELLNR